MNKVVAILMAVLALGAASIQIARADDTHRDMHRMHHHMMMHEHHAMMHHHMVMHHRMQHMMHHD